MELFFKCGKEELIFESDSVAEILDFMDKFLETMKYKSYYKRYVGTQDVLGGIMVDFGSYTDFFIIKGISFKEFIKSSQEIEVNKNTK